MLDCTAAATAAELLSTIAPPSSKWGGIALCPPGDWGRHVIGAGGVTPDEIREPVVLHYSTHREVNCNWMRGNKAHLQA